MSLEIKGAWGWVVVAFVTAAFAANAGAVLYAASIHRDVVVLELKQSTHEREQREQLVMANAEINRRLGALEAKMDAIMVTLPIVTGKSIGEKR